MSKAGHWWRDYKAETEAWDRERERQDTRIKPFRLDGDDSIECRIVHHQHIAPAFAGLFPVD